GSGIFTLVTPNPSSATVNFVPTTTVGDFEIKWNAAPSAVIYQPTLRFYYTENYVSGSAQLATPEMQLQMTQPSLSSQTSQQSVKFDKLNFYRFVGNSISYNPSVVERIAGVVEITVYAGNQILKDYININGASNSVSQEHPLYTNIEGGYGVFASRTHLTKVVSSQPTNLLHTFNLSNTGSSTTTNSVDLLATGPFTCHLLFRNSVGQVPGCQ
ncbi:MAG TPA: hypothetical protein VI731_08710, partial [Bacteroidia bacterium]|nr:hypothetical protein [Bacteroidia bacterium]